MRTVVAHAFTVDSEVDAGLEDGLVAGRTADPNPRGRRVLARPAGGLLGIRDDEGASDGLVGGLVARNEQR